MAGSTMCWMMGLISSLWLIAAVRRLQPSSSKYNLAVFTALTPPMPRSAIAFMAVSSTGSVTPGYSHLNLIVAAKCFGRSEVSDEQRTPGSPVGEQPVAHGLEVSGIQVGVQEIDVYDCGGRYDKMPRSGCL